MHINIDIGIEFLGLEELLNAFLVFDLLLNILQLHLELGEVDLLLSKLHLGLEGLHLLLRESLVEFLSRVHHYTVVRRQGVLYYLAKGYFFFGGLF